MAEQNRDMSRELNESFDDVGKVFENHFKYRHLNYQNEVLIDRYRKELVQWFMNGAFASPNPMTSVTQEHWYSLYLEKRRLEQHMIYVSYEAFDKVFNYMRRNPDDTTCTYKTDGKFLTVDINENTKLSRSFFRNGMTIHHEECTKRMRYYVISSKTPDESYICLNCGAPTTYQKLLDGCDYCGTKYTVDQFEDKVCALFSNVDSNETREVGKNVSGGVIGAIIMIAVGVVIPFFTLMPTVYSIIYYRRELIIFAIIIMIFLLIIKLGLIIGGIAVAIATQVRSDKKGPGASSLVKRDIRRTDAAYCNEEFLASLDCKIKSICYANSYYDVQNFVEGDITAMINSLQQTIICEPGAYRMKDFTTDDTYQYLTLNRELYLTLDTPSGLVKEKRIVKISLKQRRDHKIKHDVSMYRCSGCGAAISLISGGKCEYCGNGLELEKYDWVITGIEYVNSLE